MSLPGRPRPPERERPAPPRNWKRLEGPHKYDTAPKADDFVELDGDYTIGDLIQALERLPVLNGHARVAVIKLDADVARYLIAVPTRSLTPPKKCAGPQRL